MAKHNSGLLKYYHTLQPEFWNAALAKNTSHFLAIGEILVNLDCDNFISLEELIYIKNYFNQFQKKNIHLLHMENKFYTGKFGRIVISKDIFRYISYQIENNLERFLMFMRYLI